jgi:predicted GNAT family acetyltransferase
MRVEHDQVGERFFVELAVGTAQLSYSTLGDGTLDLYSTYVPEEARGRGIASRLVEAAVGHARESGAHIIPSCSYVVRWLHDHPEAGDLVAG